MASEQARQAGARIRAAREAKGWSQSELARKMPGKTDGPSVSRWERGEVMPGPQNIDRLAAALDQDAGYFYVPEPTPGVPDLMAALRKDPTQLDRIESKLNEILVALKLREGDRPPGPPDELLRRPATPQPNPDTARRGGKRPAAGSQ